MQKFLKQNWFKVGVLFVLSLFGMIFISFFVSSIIFNNINDKIIGTWKSTKDSNFVLEYDKYNVDFKYNGQIGSRYQYKIILGEDIPKNLIKSPDLKTYYFNLEGTKMWYKILKVDGKKLELTFVSPDKPQEQEEVLEFFREK